MPLINKIKYLKSQLKFNPDLFGIAGELYLNNNIEILRQYDQNIISRYILTGENICVNRLPIYYSSDINNARNILLNAPDDYKHIIMTEHSAESKRYILFTIAEYVMHAVCKLLHIYFENNDFFELFYGRLVAYLNHLSDLVVQLMFGDLLSDLPSFNDYNLSDVFRKAEEIGIETLREHVEMDHKILLTIGYLTYEEICVKYELILCPMFGAVQIPMIFNAINRFLGCAKIPFEYIKYSTYDHDSASSYLPVEEQARRIYQKHRAKSSVLILDESLGTGITVLKLKSILKDYFKTVPVASIEFRWDKKIIFNTDREWFNIDDIDYITPISYRHYLPLGEQVSNLKNRMIDFKPYIPPMVYEDSSYDQYISTQTIEAEKKANMDILFRKVKQIKKEFYPAARN